MNGLFDSISRVSLRVLPSISLALVVASTAWAHPDHAGSEHYGVSHMVLDPFHATFLIGAVVAAVAAWRVRARKSKA